MMLVFILIACIYSVSTETVGFIQQPTTDKKCYEEGDNGTLTLSFNVTGATPLHNYIVALTVNPEVTGGFKCNGTELKFYDTTDRDIQHARFRVTMSYISRTVEYWLDITVLEYHDETSPLYAFIFEIHSGKVMNVSSVGAKFHIDPTCPQRPQPDKPSMVTLAPSNNITSKVKILAKPPISEVFCTSFYILLAICLGIFSIIVFILYWFCIKRTKPKRKCCVYCSGTPMGLIHLRNGNSNL